MSDERSPAPEGSPDRGDRSPSPKQDDEPRARSATPKGQPVLRRETGHQKGGAVHAPQNRGLALEPPEKRGRSRTRSPVANGGARGRGASNPGTNLYVTGLSTRVTEEELEKLFSKEGKVAEARIVRDPRTQESRGFGFVTMAYPDEVDRVLKNLGDAIFEGRRLTVEKAKRSRERTPTPGQYRGVRGPHEGPPPRSSRYESDRYSDRRHDRDDRYGGRSSDRSDRYDDRYDRRRRSPDYGYSRRERSPYDRDRYYRR